MIASRLSASMAIAYTYPLPMRRRVAKVRARSLRTALEYARAQHPGCRVDPVAARGDAVTVRIACPGAEPRERTYSGGQ